MPDFSKRSEEIEIMDDLNCSGAVVYQTLVELETINKWLGGNAVTLSGVHSILSFRQIKQDQVIRIADVGCGGGDMLKLVASLFKKKSLKGLFVGIDANPNIIEIATANSKSFPEIKFQTQNILFSDFRSQQYDIILGTLFFHHFTTSQLIEIFSSLKNQSAIGIVINDLHRHWLAYYSIKLLTKFFSKSSMVKADGPLSVLRGFRKKELVGILQKAGIHNYSLKWKWAFRWQLIIVVG
jgi:2-polyprenyl-3-methyl-5-hydroxy-6-metoxy-1,4-benzoquinol methylase